MEETILTKLREEHDELEFLMDEILIHKKPEEREQFFKAIKSELLPHMKAEDETVYEKIASEISDNNSFEIMRKSQEEHHLLREFLQRLNLLDMESPEWLEEFLAFKSYYENHCRWEEDDLFAEVKEDYSREELVQIAHEYEENKHHQP